MQAIDVHNKLFTSDNFEYVEINKTSNSTLVHKYFVRGIKNALVLLNGLEKCFRKSNKYEDRLVKCRQMHKHSHGSNEWWNAEDIDTKIFKQSNADNNSPTNPFEITESWSTMSILCLQYQYEELSKRYNSLLKTYNDSCNSLSFYDVELSKLRKHMNEVQAELANTNESILTVGNKYLSLKHKKVLQKVWYEDKIEGLKKAIRAILRIAERTCLEL